MSDAGPDPATQRAARLLLTTFVPSLLAVIAIAAVITALYVWQHEERASTETVASAPRTPESPAASTPMTATASPSPSPSPSSTATASPTASPNAQQTSPKAPAKTSPKATTRLPLVVLNQTSRRGLGGRLASHLRAQGWTVAQVGNFRGNVAATTVYYPRGAARQASAVAAVVPGGARTRPAFANLSGSRLTVIIADDYPRR